MKFTLKEDYNGKMEKQKDLKRLIRDAGFKNLSDCCRASHENKTTLPISYGTLRNWIKGRSTPSVDIFLLDELLDLLNTDFDTFVTAIKVSRRNTQKQKKSKESSVS